MQTTGPADLGRKAADSGAAQGAQRRPRKSVGLAADRDTALWVPGLLVATTGPGDHSTVSGRQQGDLTAWQLLRTQDQHRRSLAARGNQRRKAAPTPAAGWLLDARVGFRKA